MAKRKWSQQQRLAQSEVIKQHQPWLVSTGAKSYSGKAISKMNAYKGGQRPLMRELARALKEQDIFIRKLEDSP